MQDPTHFLLCWLDLLASLFSVLGLLFLLLTTADDDQGEQKRSEALCGVVLFSDWASRSKGLVIVGRHVDGEGSDSCQAVLGSLEKPAKNFESHGDTTNLVEIRSSSIDHRSARNHGGVKNNIPYPASCCLQQSRSIDYCRDCLSIDSLNRVFQKLKRRRCNTVRSGFSDTPP